jgi:hypothetical protein
MQLAKPFTTFTAILPDSSLTVSPVGSARSHQFPARPYARSYARGEPKLGAPGQERQVIDSQSLAQEVDQPGRLRGQPRVEPGFLNGTWSPFAVAVTQGKSRAYARVPLSGTENVDSEMGTGPRDGATALIQS